MAILSVSRRTDIPSFYSDWFFKRLQTGEVCVRNPYNREQVTRYLFKPSDIDCIVFWTKNPMPMLDKLDKLDSYPFYFQFTLNGYNNDIEVGMIDKLWLIKIFQTFSVATKGNIVWRYDPIMITDKYNLEWHKTKFKYLAEQLAGYTKRCVISFADMYNSAQSNLNASDIFPKEMTKDDMRSLCEFIAETARQNGMEVFTCVESVYLDDLGIKHGSCIDKDFVEKVAGFPIKTHKDKGQRKECGCIESIDIGKYDTCRNGCKYCYACNSSASLHRNISAYNVDSPLLCDLPLPTDKVTVKQLKSLKSGNLFDQMTLF